jgi:hypothetical protein
MSTEKQMSPEKHMSLEKAQYILYSAAYGNFSKIEHTLGHKISLKRYRKTEITLSTTDHNVIKLRCNNKRSRRKYINN